MRYHNITHNDMLNGNGLRTVLWVAGCTHHCQNCQNPETWNVNGGIPFDIDALMELINGLNQKHISGITFTGGDPLHPDNRKDVLNLCNFVKKTFSDKDIWIYTGYQFETILAPNFACGKEILELTDVLVDGEYIEALRDTSLHWIGSSNQRVIDVPQTLKTGKICKLGGSFEI